MGCIHRSTNSSIDNNKEMLDMIYQKLLVGNYLLVEDFNYRQVNWELLNIHSDENRTEYAFIQCIDDLYLYQHVKNPTRYRQGNTPCLPDLILTNEEQMIGNLHYNPGFCQSDHLILQFDNICSVKENNEKQSKYNFNKPLCELKWKNGEEMGVQRSLDDFKENLTNNKETHIPISKMNLKRLNRYIDQETKQAFSKKDTQNCPK